MNHLETLIGEWFEYRGYFVRRNVKVGRLSRGGFEGELDVVAYHPQTSHLIHVEPSIDAHPWSRREVRFEKQFAVGRKYILQELFKWLPPGIGLEQWAVVLGADTQYQTIGAGKVVPLKKLIQQITDDVRAVGPMESNAIPEIYPLLRTVQFVVRWDNVPLKPSAHSDAVKGKG
jgi:hypothetical protein